MKYYHVTLPNGSQVGPYDEASLQNYVATGQLSRDCMVWTQGMSAWMPFAQVFPTYAPAPAPMPVLYASPVPVLSPDHPLYSHYVAATQGNVDSQHYLGCCYLKGEHVSFDTKSGVYWLQCAAQQGNYASCIALAQHLGNNHSRSDVNKAIHWAKTAASISNTAEAQQLITSFNNKLKESKPSAMSYVAVVGLVFAIIILCSGDGDNMKPGTLIPVFGVGLLALAKIIFWRS